MDFLPASGYSGGHGGAPVWWPVLVDAVLAVAYAKPVAVRVIVSKWAHTAAEQPAAMRRLADGLAACEHAWTRCAGSLEVRQYEVPGWNVTTGSHATVGARWPTFTRVNHQKYIVSDTRLNIGTSNWEWGYFHQTAGSSFNTDAPELVAAAQAVFDADWSSGYAHSLYDDSTKQCLSRP
jgi:phospholipase D3/4